MAILHAKRKVTCSRITMAMKATFKKWRSLRTIMFMKSCISFQVRFFQIGKSRNTAQHILSKWQNYCVKFCYEGSLWRFIYRKKSQKIINEKKGGYSNKVHLTQEMHDRSVPKICLPQTKLVLDELYPFNQRDSTRSRRKLMGLPIWQRQVQEQCEEPPELLTSSEEDRYESSRNEKRRQPIKTKMRKFR
jgi:hypothetical protein